MITIGGDSHKRTHTFVAVDEVGRKVAETTVAATTGQSCTRRLPPCRHRKDSNRNMRGFAMACCSQWFWYPSVGFLLRTTSRGTRY